MKYLMTFDKASASELAEIKPAAVKGCIGAVKAPIVSFTEQVRARGRMRSRRDVRCGHALAILHVKKVEVEGRTGNEV